MATELPQESLPDFCSTRDAARQLGVSIKTVQLWVESGVLQAWKTPGGHRRITTVSLRGLLAQRHKTTQPAPPTLAATPALFNLLVVDDDAHTRRLYELTIPHWGLPMTLTTAQDGFEGLIRIGEHKPDILITDLQMPGMDGYRMISALRSNPVYRSIHIIVVSGLNPADIHRNAAFHRDIPLFPKPIPFDSLRNAVEGFLVST